MSIAFSHRRISVPLFESRRSSVGVIIAIVLCSTFCSTALAQPWSSVFETPGRSIYGGEFLDDVRSALEWSPEERKLLEEHFQKHAATLRGILEESSQEWEKGRSAATELDLSSPEGEMAMIALMKRTAQIADRHRREEQQFLVSVREMLAQDQRPLFDELVSEFNRDRLQKLNQAAPWVTVDLLGVVKEVKPSEESAEQIALVLATYPSSRDRLIMQIIDDDIRFWREWWRSDEVRHKQNQLYRNEGYTPESIAKAKSIGEINWSRVRRKYESQRQLGNLNRSFATAILGILEDRDTKERFEELCQFGAYPDAYRAATKVDHDLSRIRALATLTEAQRTQVDSEDAAFRKRRREASDAMAAAIDRQFEHLRGRPVDFDERWTEAQNAVSIQHNAILRLDDEMLDRLFHLLTSEQQGTLPRSGTRR